MSHQKLPDLGNIGVVHGNEDQEAPGAVAAMVGRNEHVAQPRERRPVGNQPGEADLLTCGRVQADHERMLDRPGHHLTRPALGPVAFAADPAVHEVDIDAGAIIAGPVAVRAFPSHSSSTFRVTTSVRGPRVSLMRQRTAQP
jgi:hypothetical protein